MKNLNEKRKEVVTSRSRKIMNLLTLIMFSMLTFNCNNEEFQEYETLEGGVQKASVTIKNPGFESGKSDWGSESNYAISGDEHSGSSAGKVTKSSGKVEQTVSVSKNTSYVLKAWVDGDGKLSIGGETKDFDVDEYTEVSVSFNSGNSSSVTILGTRDSGDVRFDDFSLTSTGDDGGSGTGSSDENIALGKTAEQYDTAYNGAASRAVDGNTSGIWGHGSITHTSRVSKSWWQVLLGKEYAVGDIVIWNRTNCCSSRLSNFDVILYDNDGKQVASYYVANTPSPSVTISADGAVASRVRVQLRGTNYLSLAEVQVFGTEDDNEEEEEEEEEEPDNPSGDNPSSILADLDEWKITFPLDKDGKDSTNDSKTGNDCDDRNRNAYELRDITGSIPSPYSDYFYVNGDEVFFKAHCGGATTNGSFYPRSELRQTPGGDDNYWSMSKYQYLDVRVRAVNIPSEKPEVSMVQIHGPDDEPLRVEYRADDQGLHVVQNEDSTEEYILPYSLGQQLRVTVTVESGYITCKIVNEDTGRDWSDTWKSEDSTGYFKVGCYTQSTMFVEDCKSGEGFSDESPNAYGLVAVKDLTLKVTY